jgi:ABC-type multidrug transport system fused ATPase/permease subunit
MDRLLTLQYYFTPRPDPVFKYTTLTLLLIALLIFLGIAIRVYRKKYVKDPIVKKMIKRYPSRFYIFAFILLFLLWAREAGIPYLSMRIGWFILFAVILVWAVKIALNFKKEYHFRSKQAHKNAQKGKYLPRKKKK